MATIQQIEQAEKIADELVDVAFGTTIPRTDVDLLGEKTEMLQALRDACMKCRMCKFGWQTAVRYGVEHQPQTFSNMNITPYIIVGQGPGWDELGGTGPFLGVSGDIFNTELELWGHSRSEFYITNAMKCFISCNINPSKKCTKICSAYLQSEFALIRPKFVIALGDATFEMLCPKKKFSDCMGKITRSEEYGVNVFAVYHPSYTSLAIPECKRAFKRQIKVICSLMDRLNSV